MNNFEFSLYVLCLIPFVKLQFELWHGILPFLNHRKRIQLHSKMLAFCQRTASNNRHTTHVGLTLLWPNSESIMIEINISNISSSASILIEKDVGSLQLTSKLFCRLPFSCSNETYLISISWNSLLSNGLIISSPPNFGCF